MHICAHIYGALYLMLNFIYWTLELKKKKQNKTEVEQQKKTKILNLKYIKRK